MCVCVCAVKLSTSIVVVAEGGSSTYSVVLTSAPSSDVSVALSLTTTAGASVGSSLLVFGASNWNTVQYVVVSVASDASDRYVICIYTNVLNCGVFAPFPRIS